MVFSGAKGFKPGVVERRTMTKCINRTKQTVKLLNPDAFMARGAI